MGISASTAPSNHQHALPAHVAIIMDGNGRWAKSRGLPRTAGHKRGAEALRSLLEGCESLGLSYLTIYAFSSENWQRPEQEVNDLMDLLKIYLSRELSFIHKHNIRLRFIGDRSRLADDIQKQLKKAEELTAQNAAFHLTVALSYGAREEILRTARTLAAQAVNGEISADAIDERLFSHALDTAELPDPDLLIRTGGEQRLSNFLLWQSAYTELYFTDVLWPDFNAGHLSEAMEVYSQRERRFGNASA